MWICPDCRTIYKKYGEVCERDGEPLAEVQAHQIKARYPMLDRVIDGRYHLIGGLGQGGLGTVYLAQHLHLEQLFAVKFLDLETVGLNVNKQQKREYQTDFMKEARVASLIRHDSVVRVSDFGEFERLPYLVMEYVPGLSLLAKIQERGRFTVAEATRIARKIADALNAFHERQLVHRDLKPANVILDPRGEGLLTLVDLGLVKDISGPAGRISTHPMALRGTPGYLAPEQVPKWVLSGAGIQLPGDKRLVDARVDIYALGVIFYEMLAGLSPYPDGSNTQIIVYTCTREPLSLRKVDPPIELSPALEQLIYDTMSRDPADRPQSASEFIKRLDQIDAQAAEDEAWPVMATSIGRAAQPKPIHSRHMAGPTGQHDRRLQTQFYSSMDEDFTEAQPASSDADFSTKVGRQFDTVYDSTMEAGSDSFDGLLDHEAFDRSSVRGPFGRRDELNQTRVDGRSSDGSSRDTQHYRVQEPPPSLADEHLSQSVVSLDESHRNANTIPQNAGESRGLFWFALVLVSVLTMTLIWFLIPKDSETPISSQQRTIAPESETSVPGQQRTIATQVDKEASKSRAPVKNDTATPGARDRKRSNPAPNPLAQPGQPSATSKVTAPADKTTAKGAERDASLADVVNETNLERAFEETESGLEIINSRSRSARDRSGRRLKRSRTRAGSPRKRTVKRAAVKQDLTELVKLGDAALDRRDYATAATYYERLLKRASKDNIMYITVKDRLAVCKARQ